MGGILINISPSNTFPTMLSLERFHQCCTFLSWQRGHRVTWIAMAMETCIPEKGTCFLEGAVDLSVRGERI